MTIWHQTLITLPSLPRGFHLVTSYVERALPELVKIRVGLLHLFLQHTSASISINENADPDVREDLESSFNSIVPESFPYVHTIEGRDDMPAHIKSAMIGVSLTVPVGHGRLSLGTWQGIYLCEHRDRGGPRRLIATLQGSTN